MLPPFVSIPEEGYLLPFMLAEMLTPPEDLGDKDLHFHNLPLPSRIHRRPSETISVKMRIISI